jgi:lysophospholipase L1-like esterase
MKIIKIILVNIGIFLLLIFLINLLLVFTWEIRRAVFIDRSIGLRSQPSTAEHLASLPNYAEAVWAQKHFEEFFASKREYRSYLGWRSLSFSGETLNMDEQGIRYTPQHSNVYENAPLVVFLGGSTIWGYGAPDSLTIPAIIASRSMGRYKTLNFGESAYRSFQGYLFLLLQMHEGLRPNVIVSYDGVNDANGFRTELSGHSHSREHQIREVMKGKDTPDEVRILTFRSLFLGPIEATVSRLKKKKSAGPLFSYTPERADAVARALLNSWMSTKDLADRHGALYIAVLQPNASVGRPRLDHLKIDTLVQVQQKYYYPRVLELLENDPLYAPLKDNFLDLSTCLDGDEYFFIDPGHISPNGNAIIAHHILTKLDAMMEERRDIYSRN